MTRLLLEGEGYEVATLSSPFGASKGISDFQPDLVLLDVNMPALSGEGLADLLLRNTRLARIPILFYTSNDSDTVRPAVRRTGVAGWISKRDLRDLRDKVRAYPR